MTKEQAILAILEKFQHVDVRTDESGNIESVVLTNNYDFLNKTKCL